ncbi:MAG: hypothetical protein KDA96_03595 [Planctomycetaceae bacterium]|nr:hypothetical protein [Planctomycetaceae bacterium]
MKITRCLECHLLPCRDHHAQPLKANSFDAAGDRGAPVRDPETTFRSIHLSTTMVTLNYPKWAGLGSDPNAVAQLQHSSAPPQPQQLEHTDSVPAI